MESSSLVAVHLARPTRVADIEQLDGWAPRPEIGQALDDVQGVVGSLLDALAAVENGDPGGRSDLAWLRPLAVLFAELEHSARYRRNNAEAALAVCGELSRFMSGVGCPRGFSLRYDGIRGRNPSIAMLHLRVLRSCRHVFELGSERSP